MSTTTSIEAALQDREAANVSIALESYQRARAHLRAARDAWAKTEHTAELEATERMIASLNEGLELSA